MERDGGSGRGDGETVDGTVSNRGQVMGQSGGRQWWGRQCMLEVVMADEVDVGKTSVGVETH